MKRNTRCGLRLVVTLPLALSFFVAAYGQDTKKKSPPTGATEASKKQTSNLPVQKKEDFASVVKRMKADKPAIIDRHKKLLAERYDLSDRAAKGVTMSRGKPVQEGACARLPRGTSWDDLAAMTPPEIRDQGIPSRFPAVAAPIPRRRRHDLPEIPY